MAESETSEPSARRPVLTIVANRASAETGAERGKAGRGPVTFERSELNLLFRLYGARVAAGEWRDYALDFTPARAVFSVFRRSSEAPLYRIEKTPELARRQGAFAVIASGDMILRRGHDLSRVLRVLDKPLRLVSAE